MMSDTSTKTDEVSLEETLDDISWSSLFLSPEQNQTLGTLEHLLPYDHGGFDEFLNDLCELKEKNLSEYQKLLTPKNNTTETPYELRLAEVDHDDGLSFYLSLLYGFDRRDVIPARCLRNNVANHILQSQYIKDNGSLCKINRKTREKYCDKIKQGAILGGPIVFNASASLYPKYLLCVITKTKCAEGNIFINVSKYVTDSSSCKKCVFIFYDGIAGYYSHLYLYNKANKEEKGNFKYDDDTMKILVYKFIQQKLKDDNYNDSDDIREIVQPDISVNEFMEVDNIYHSIVPYDVMDTEKPFENYENSSMNNVTKICPSSISNTNTEIDDHISTGTSKGAFETTQEIVRKSVDRDNHCLFSSLRNVLGIDDKITIKDIRKQAADFNRQPGKVDEECLFSETGKSLKQYCDDMENTDVWGGEAEIRAIAESYKIIVRVITVDHQKSRVSISELPSNQTSFDKCCYIILDDNHYESLHLRIGNNSNDERAIFDCNDEEVKKLICDFIGNKYPNYEFVSSANKTDGDEQAVQPVQKCNQMKTMTDTKNLSKKRKLREDVGNSSMGETTNILASSILNRNNVNIQSSTYIRAIPSNDIKHALDKNNELSSNIEELLQIDSSSGLNCSPGQQMKLQQMEDSSTTNISVGDTTISHKTENRQKIRLQIEPAKHFELRTIGNIVPKNEYTRDGRIAKLGKPIYFADRSQERKKNARRSLTLLIPTAPVFGKNPVDLHRVQVEICIVTPTIDECIYKNPYFKLYEAGNHGNYSLSNPIFIQLGNDKDYKKLNEIKGNLTEIEEILHMKLYLTVIQISNIELVSLEKLIEPFKLNDSKELPDTNGYTKCDKMKNKFQLTSLRFAITLWIKDDGEEAYNRRDDLQYISEISTGHPRQSSKSHKKILPRH